MKRSRIREPFALIRSRFEERGLSRGGAKLARVSSVCYVPTASSACLLDPDLISISHENPSFPHRGESEVFVRLALRITKNFLLWLYVSMWNRLIECWMLLRFLCKIWSMSYFVFFFFFLM